MCTGEFLFGAVAHFVTLFLTFVNILAQHLCILPVASLTRAVDIGQRRHDVVVGVLHASLLLVRHVAVSTTHSALAVDAL